MYLNLFRFDAIALSLMCVLMTAGLPALAQSELIGTDVLRSSLTTFSSMLDSRVEKRGELDQLKQKLAAAKDEVEQAQLVEAAEALNQELDELNEQIGILATGVSAKEFDLAGGQSINLQGELEQLVQPFVIMLKSATADARQIEQLRHKLLAAQAHISVGEKALEGIKPMISTNEDESVAQELDVLNTFWEGKLSEATDLQATLKHQLNAKLEAQRHEAETSESVFASFFRDRGLSLLMGFGAAALVFALTKVLASAFSYARTRGGVARSFKVRLSALLFNIFSAVAALGAMLYVFNARNDWLLLGLVVLLVFALIWMGLKMLPDMIEQITTLLNLGAVQEGERLLFEGIPWHVTKLDFYTDLDNPALEGGSVTLPVRELAGLHSRPAAKDEAWFPSRSGDWVKMEDGTVAKVVFQSPETVQLVELGGARHTITAPTYFASAPVNLSSNARVEIEFGVSYKHQAIAAHEIPEKLAEFVRRGLYGLLEKDELLDVNVELLACNASSLDYEVEADLLGAAAHKYEDVERALTRLCLEACNEFGWEIPFPQLVVHSS
ncbi:MAG: hypothetical protein AB8B86_10870 [Pseudomonadales bacterium]